MRFELTPEEDARVAEWLKSLQPKIADLLPDILHGTGVYGSIGGGVTYELTPTSVGMVIKVREFHTGEVLDLTDWDTW
jgi:hypothetical protein